MQYPQESCFEYAQVSDSITGIAKEVGVFKTGGRALLGEENLCEIIRWRRRRRRGRRKVYSKLTQ